jgi:hypothetical protein
VSLNKHKMAIRGCSHYLLCILSWVSVYRRMRIVLYWRWEKASSLHLHSPEGNGMSQTFTNIWSNILLFITAGCRLGCLSCVANDCRVVDVCSG